MSKYENSKDALEFIHTLDSIAIKKQKEEIERLQAENERLRKAGDEMVKAIDSAVFFQYDAEHEIKAWNEAKDGNPSV